MGRHRKRDSHTARRLAAVATSGAFAAVPLTYGVARADVDWSAIARCESGGNPHAHNATSSAAGLYQFVSGTWASLGGLAFGRTAADATAAQQTQIAERAYQRSGLTPWASSRTCWSSAVHTNHRRLVARGSRTYVVRAGDTLGSIAAEHQVTWRELFAANRAVVANPDLIHVGISLRL